MPLPGLGRVPRSVCTAASPDALSQSYPMPFRPSSPPHQNKLSPGESDLLGFYHRWPRKENDWAAVGCVRLRQAASGCRG
eukprot:scaffold87669_cov60-Phaeocystis_antarctica.AAC.5